MNKVTITEISRNLADYINRVVYRGESFILVRGKKPVAELKPVMIGKKLGELEETIRSLPVLGEGELDSFVADLVDIRALGNTEGLRDIWES